MDGLRLRSGLSCVGGILGTEASLRGLFLFSSVIPGLPGGFGVSLFFVPQQKGKHGHEEGSFSESLSHVPAPLSGFFLFVKSMIILVLRS